MQSTHPDPTDGLFSNEREANLDSTIAMVEDILIELGHIVEECRLAPEDHDHAWKVQKGSAQTLVELLQDGNGYRIRAVATVVTCSDDCDRFSLFERVLSLNANQVRGAAFALDGEKILLTSERSTLDLDRSELLSLISVVRDLADKYDDKLVSEFSGVSLGGEAISTVSR